MNVKNSFEKEQSLKENIKKALKKWRFWRNILISGIMPFGIFFIFATYRAYASMLGVEGKILGTLAGTLNIIGSTCNPIWAFFADKYGFQTVMKILSIFVLALPIYFFIFMDNQIFYIIGVYISCIFRGGIMSCITPHIMHIYGLRYYLVLGGLGKLFNQLFNFFIEMISIIISIWNSNYIELLLPYRIVCVVGVIIAKIGFIFVFYETDEKFKFDDEEKKNNEKKANKELTEEIIKKEENDDKKEENQEVKNNEENNEKI